MGIFQTGRYPASIELILYGAIACIILFCLYVVNLNNFLLFHSLVEIASIVVAFSIFVIVWNTRRTITSTFFLIIGISFLFSGTIDLVHMLAYKGMSVFPGNSADLPTQLWIAARYYQSITFLIATLLIRRSITKDRKYDDSIILVVCAAAFCLVMTSIFLWQNFPCCYIEGTGLTPFKIASEYVISAFLILAIIILALRRSTFNPVVWQYLIAAQVFLIVGELAFTTYVGVYDFMNMIGHLAKLVSVYFFYRAIVVVALTHPLDLLFSELKEKSMALEQSNNQLKMLDRLKSMFIASMSHELRTPLNSIIGFTGILIKGMAGELNAEQKKQLGMVQESSRHLLSLINDVIDISKIEAGNIEADISQFNLADVFREVENTFGPTAQERGLVLTVEIPESITITSDERRIKQVIMNLVSNAIKFTDEGRIGLTVRQEGMVVEVRVSDTGIGIGKEDLEQLFRPFVRVQVPGRFTEGTGLGLYLSKKLVQFLGGDITVESELQKGSMFTFSFLATYEKQEDL